MKKRSVFKLAVAFGVLGVLTGSAYPAEAGSAEAETEAQILYPFDGIRVNFSGWNGFATISDIDASGCDVLVQRYISFSPEEEYEGLTEGDQVTILASVDEDGLLSEGYKVEQTEFVMSAEHLQQVERVWGDFHDGVTWLQVYFGPEETSDCVVDIEGNVLYKCQAGEDTGSDFYDGVCQMRDRLMDKQGNTVWSVEDAVQYGESIWGPGSVRDVFLYAEYENDDHWHYYGYTKLYLTVDCFDFSGEAYGIIDSRGNWLVEPVRDKYGYGYETFGVCRPDSLSVYNILTGDYTEFPDTQEGYQLCEETYNQWALQNEAVREGGLTLRYELDGYPVTGFYAPDGTLKIDLSAYELSSLDSLANEGAFYDGYRSLRIKNQDGGAFYTVIDEEGDRVLYPVREWFHGPFTGKYFVWLNDDYQDPDERYSYLDIAGTNVFGETYYEARDFQEDRAFVRKGGESYHCIDTDGKMIF